MTVVARQSRRACPWVVYDSGLYDNLPTLYARYDSSNRASILDTASVGANVSSFNNDVRTVRDISGNNRHLKAIGNVTLETKVTYQQPSSQSIPLDSYIEAKHRAKGTNLTGRRLQYTLPARKRYEDFTLSIVGSFSDLVFDGQDAIFNSGPPNAVGTFSIATDGTNIVYRHKEALKISDVKLAPLDDKVRVFTIMHTTSSLGITRIYVDGVSKFGKASFYPTFDRLSYFSDQQMATHTGGKLLFSEMFNGGMTNEQLVEYARFQACRWGL